MSKNIPMWLHDYLHSEYPSGTLRSKKFQTTLILAFEANSATTWEYFLTFSSETKIMKITHSAILTYLANIVLWIVKWKEESSSFWNHDYAIWQKLFTCFKFLPQEGASCQWFESEFQHSNTTAPPICLTWNYRRFVYRWRACCKIVPSCLKRHLLSNIFAIFTNYARVYIVH